MTTEGFREVLNDLPFLLQGLRWTLQISLVGIVAGSILGLFIGLGRISRWKVLRFPASLYVDFFRTTPLLVQLVWIYFALPIIIGQSLAAVEAGELGLTLYSAAFLAEIYRAGILAVPKGHTEAGLALGMKPRQVMRRIVLPQAIVNMLPPIASTFISLVKDSSIASIVSVPELLHQGQVLGTMTFRPTEALSVIALMYLCITYPLSLAVNFLHRRLTSTRAPRSGHGPDDPLTLVLEDVHVVPVEF
jgi:His/Glu/Gln/Arg/opine family amino acid ABC transporter permease subunit